MEEKIIFEISSAGKKGYTLPELDVEIRDIDEFLVKEKQIYK